MKTVSVINGTILTDEYHSANPFEIKYAIAGFDRKSFIDSILSDSFQRHNGNFLESAEETIRIVAKDHIYINDSVNYVTLQVPDQE